MSELPFENRREYVRVEAVQPVSVKPSWSGRKEEAQTIDLSGGGMLLSAGALEVGLKLEFELALGPGEEPVRGTATVVREAGEDSRWGLRFDEIDARDQQRLIRFVFQASGPRSRRRAIEAQALDR